MGFVAIAALTTLERSNATWRNGTLLPATFFRPRSVRVGLLVLVPTFASFSGLLFFPLWLQDGLGYSAPPIGVVTVSFSAGGLALTLLKELFLPSSPASYPLPTYSSSAPRFCLALAPARTNLSSS